MKIIKYILSDEFPPNQPVADIGDTVHIWIYWHTDKFTSNPTLLNESEISRANSYLNQKNRDKFIADRTNLKRILSYYTGRDPKEVLFSFEKNGKPYLENNEVMFNLSHSGDISVYAVSNRRIGVDIEKIRDIPYLDDIAEHFFTEDESKIIRNNIGLRKTKAFFQVWTRKEAAVKMLGMGFRAFDLDLSKYLVKHFSPDKQFIGAVSIAT